MNTYTFPAAMSDATTEELAQALEKSHYPAIRTPDAGIQRCSICNALWPCNAYKAAARLRELQRRLDRAPEPNYGMQAGITECKVDAWKYSDWYNTDGPGRNEP